MEIKINTARLAKVVKDFRLKFVILHGSFVTGFSRSDSDVDIAVLGYREISFEQLLDLDVALRDALPVACSRDLDLKTLDKVDPLFRYEVVRTGKLLYGNAADYEEFKAFATRAYEDARPLLELEEHLARKFQVYLNQRHA